MEVVINRLFIPQTYMCRRDLQTHTNARHHHMPDSFNTSHTTNKGGSLLSESTPLMTVPGKRKGWKSRQERSQYRDGAKKHLQQILAVRRHT